MRPMLISLGVLALAATLPAVPAAAATPKPGAVFRDCLHCPQMVALAPGSVTVGSEPAEQQREQVTPQMAGRETPRHRVTIAKAIAVGRYEVTRGEFDAFVKATGRDQMGCSVMNPAGGGYITDPAKSYRDPGYAQTDRHPAVCVNWNDAVAYAAWLAKETGKPYRLLTEGEWEYAARGGTTTARWWGDGRDGACIQANVQALDGMADPSKADAERNFLCKDGYPNTAPVGSFKANGFGLYDVHGNVWEWTQDCYDGDVQRAPADGSAYTGGDCARHMDRGASWQNTPKYVRSAARHMDLVDHRNLILGFRIARDLP